MTYCQPAVHNEKGLVITSYLYTDGTFEVNVFAAMDLSVCWSNDRVDAKVFPYDKFMGGLSEKGTKSDGLRYVIQATNSTLKVFVKATMDGNVAKTYVAQLAKASPESGRKFALAFMLRNACTVKPLILDTSESTEGTPNLVALLKSLRGLP